MSNYFYIDSNGNQVGPVSLKQLKERRLIPDTLVWREGMSDWDRLSSVEELINTIKVSIPPLPPSIPVNKVPIHKPESYMVWAILSTILCSLPAGIVAIVYASKVDTQWEKGEYDAAVKSSKNVKIWCFVALGLFALSLMFGFMILLIGALS